MTSEKTETRRRHSAAVKAQVVADCDGPGASIATAAMSNGINPNVVHRWRQLARPKLGRNEEAKAAAARVVELQPSFRYGRQFAGVDCEPALATTLAKELRAAGLPE
jgi:transposase-like protein